MNIEMTDGMRAVADICHTIVRKVDRAYIAECGRRRQMPHELWQMWADTGLLSIGLPENMAVSAGR
jgi:acyl-CoA dehydrogenase